MTTPEQHPPAADDLSSETPDTTESAEATQTPKSEPDPVAISAGRPALIEAVVERDRGSNSSVRVVLERNGVKGVAERQAVGEEGVVLRSVAEATLDAVAELAGEQRFALVGVKHLLAFDSAVVLACVRITEGPPRKLIGCVPIQDDAVLAVARAVLHATNRIVESIPNADDAAGHEMDQAEDDVAHAGADPSD